jgi:hypothetical protein
MSMTVDVDGDDEGLLPSPFTLYIGTSYGETFFAQVDDVSSFFRPGDVQSLPLPSLVPSNFESELLLAANA